MFVWADHWVVAGALALASALLATLMRRRAFLFVALFFLFFNFAARLVSLAFIDLYGPLYAEQLYRKIGPGLATPVFVAAFAVFFVPIVLLFSEGNLRRIVPPAPAPAPAERTIDQGDVLFASGLLVVLGLFADMVRIGVIPLFDALEQFEYTNRHAGALHRLLKSHGFFFVFLMGYGFAQEWIRIGAPKYRFVVLMGLLFVYLFLTGNRYSAFYAFLSFFALPVAGGLIVLRFDRGRLLALSGAGMRRVMRALAVLGLSLVVIIPVALAHSYFRVRAIDDDPLFKITQRALIQPSELAWLTFERVFREGRWEPQAAIDGVFLEPVDPERNTGIQHLMVIATGKARATEILDQGFQYTGGFPEIVFELFGPVMSWPVLLVAGWVTGALLFLVLRAVIEGHVLTAFTGFYVLFGVLLFDIGGMVNFIMPWTYWFKVCALLTCVVLERTWARRGHELVPWILFGNATHGAGVPSAIPPGVTSQRN